MNLRKYGTAPFDVAVIHGGPGAGGEMAAVARVLSSNRGVLEPLQTATSLEGQVEELKTILEENGDLPVTLIGFSYGAHLSFILAARYPAMVKRVVLVGSGPFEEKYASGIMETRLARLSDEERAEVKSLLLILDDPDSLAKNWALARMGAIFSIADAYDPLVSESEICESDSIVCNADIFQGVWKDASLLRRNGELLELGKNIRSPVIAIHGDYDPHPAIGVRDPLRATLKSFSFVLLRNCGHMPWIERWARDKFYGILNEVLD